MTFARDASPRPLEFFDSVARGRETRWRTAERRLRAGNRTRRAATSCAIGTATASSAPLKVCPHCQAENQTAAKVCPRCGKRFRPRKRWPWVVIGIVILLVATVVGFVMYVGAVNNNASKKLDTQQALHAITQQQFDAVALGAPRAGVISQLGKQPQDARQPAANEAPIDNNTAPCIYYGRTGGGFGDSYQFCFASDVLSSKAPY